MKIDLRGHAKMPPFSSQMKPTDDVWNDIITTTTGSLPSPATTNRFQNFFLPSSRTTAGTTAAHFLPPPPSTATMLTLLTSTNNNSVVNLDLNTATRPKPNPPPCNFTTPAANSPPEYTEKFRRLMKNRESAARSRARKQARADELEHEVMRLAKENAKLRRLQKQVCNFHVPKDCSRLQRTKSAPF